MNRYQCQRNAGRLWIYLGVVVAYHFLLVYWRALSSRPMLAGVFGVLLGLFVCSRGAANLLDIILFGRLMQPADASKYSQARWVGLNVLVLAVGWSAIVVGAIQLAQATPPGANALTAHG